MTPDLHEKVAMAGVGEKGDAAGWLQRPVTTEVRAAWLAERLRYLEVTGERRRHAPPPSFSLSLSLSRLLFPVSVQRRGLGATSRRGDEWFIVDVTSRRR